MLKCRMNGKKEKRETKNREMERLKERFGGRERDGGRGRRRREREREKERNGE